MEEIKIGNQIWASFNLSVDKFANGDLIQEAKSFEEWKYCGLNRIPAFCIYENKLEIETVYGKLYNWFAVDDKRRLAPKEWRIPSIEDYVELLDILEQEKDREMYRVYSNGILLGCHYAGTKMKSINGWLNNNGVSGNGNNSSGFNGLPGGSRIGRFSDLGRYGNFWCSSERDDEHAHDLVLYYSGSNVSIGHGANKRCGFSVRCLKI